MQRDASAPVRIARNVAVTAAVLLPCVAPRAAAVIDEAAFDRCRAMSNDTARLRCFEGLTRSESRSLVPQPIGRWRLVRTPHPQGGKDAVSIMRSGELAESDPDFAGLMLRCGDNDVEVLIAVITPFAPRARPAVAVRAGGSSTEFAAGIVPPGTLLQLPPQAAALARTGWLRSPDVTVSITDEDRRTIAGKVLLADFAPALQLLDTNCAAR